MSAHEINALFRLSQLIFLCEKQSLYKQKMGKYELEKQA
jgi:hypothetical protein